MVHVAGVFERLFQTEVFFRTHFEELGPVLLADTVYVLCPLRCVAIVVVQIYKEQLQSFVTLAAFFTKYDFQSSSLQLFPRTEISWMKTDYNRFLLTKILPI